MPLADYQDLVDNLVRDAGGEIDAATRDQAIEAARLQYSADRPREAYEDLVISESGVSLPAGWIRDFSAVAAVEWPVDQRPPVFVAEVRITLYDAGPSPWIYLDGVTDGETARVSFTTYHDLDAGADTIPLHHRHPVAGLAAADLLGQLASATAGDESSTLSTDAVDHGGKSRRYAARARELRDGYRKALERKVASGGAEGTIVTAAQPSGHRLGSMFHRRR